MIFKKKTHVFWLLHGLVFILDKTNLFTIVFVQNFVLCDYGTLKWSDVKLCMTNRHPLVAQNLCYIEEIWYIAEVLKLGQAIIM